jgi:hypothetical protein
MRSMNGMPINVPADVFSSLDWVETDGDEFPLDVCVSGKRWRFNRTDFVSFVDVVSLDVIMSKRLPIDDGGEISAVDWESDLNFFVSIFSSIESLSFFFPFEDELILFDETTTRFDDGAVWTIVRIGILFVDSPMTTFRLTTNRGWDGGVVVSSEFIFGESVIILRVVDLVELGWVLLFMDESFVSLDNSVSDGIAIRRTTISVFTIGEGVSEFNEVLVGVIEVVSFFIDWRELRLDSEVCVGCGIAVERVLLAIGLVISFLIGLFNTGRMTGVVFRKFIRGREWINVHSGFRHPVGVFS